jgi:DNA-binding CsgD family transcriptional regulator
MATPLWVSENDLRTMLRIVNAPDLGEDGEALPLSTLQALCQLIPNTMISFNGIDVEQKSMYLSQSIGGIMFSDEREQELNEIFWALYPGSYCSYPERSGDYRSIMTTSDLFSMREFRQSPLYVDYLAYGDYDHEIAVVLPDGARRQLRLVIFRGRRDPDFTDRDRALLTLLRPHLRAAHLEVLRRRRGLPTLTARQWELLRLVEQGLGNKQIARRLQISDNTVRKHLENIYERLAVSSRTAAVARAFPARTVR